jgi:quercetin dioxygenase-like cupin family protein
MPNQPLPLHKPAELIDPELATLLDEPFASALAASGPAHERLEAASSVRLRLLDRLAISRAQAEVMFTVRHARLQALEIAPGVSAKTLYAVDTERPLRAGEPTRARLVEFAPGSTWSGPEPTRHREWLVLEGEIQLGDERLRPRDYHVDPLGHAAPAARSDHGAVVFLRESAVPALEHDQPFTVCDADAGWPDYAPGIQRRVLWQRGGEAALLYYAQPGACVPGHAHGHDEECLMLQGEFFLDDVLLQPGDYQLAPAGTGHRISETDTGVVIYAHGDLDLQFTG